MRPAFESSVLVDRDEHIDMRLQETRYIDRPLGEVFAFTADFANAESRDPGVVSSRRVDDGPLGVGAQYEVIVAFGSRAFPMTYEISDYDQDARVVLTVHLRYRLDEFQPASPQGMPELTERLLSM